MFSKALARSVPLGDSICGNGMLMPFLYRTRTITRAYTVQEKASPGERPIDEPESVNTSTPTTLSRHVARFHSKKSLDRSAETGDYLPPERSHAASGQADETNFEGETINETSEWRNKSREDFVPFEGLPQKRDLNKDLEGSTITPSERRAFESLLSLSPSRPGPKQKALQSTSEDDEGTSNLDHERRANSLDALLNTALASPEQATSPRLPAALRSTVEAARSDGQLRYRRLLERRRQDRLLRANETSEQRAARNELEKELHRRQTALGAAKTDSEVWKLFRTHVVEKLVTLDLDRKRVHLTTEQRFKDRASEAPENTKTEEQGANGVQTVLGTPQSLGVTSPRTDEVSHGLLHSTAGSKHLDNSVTIGSADIESVERFSELTRRTLAMIQDTFFTLFQSSPLALSILPAIRSLGPATAAFILSSNTYEHHMRSSWAQYQDPSQLVAIFREMDTNVISFTGDTLFDPVTAIKFAKRAQEGRYGPSVQVLWNMEGKTKALRELSMWRRIVRQRSDETALRLARDAEVQRTLEDEVGLNKFKYAFDAP